MKTQIFFSQLDIAVIVCAKRQDDAFVKTSDSITNQFPHFIIVHTSVWRKYPKITTEVFI